MTSRTEPEPPGVPVLDWPRDEPTRRVLASLGVPRLLRLAPGAPPPARIDELEDWLVEPIDPAEHHTRSRALVARAAAAAAVAESTAPAPSFLYRGAHQSAPPSPHVIPDAGSWQYRGVRVGGAPAPREPGAIEVDGAGCILRVGTKWTALSRVQVPITRLLVARLGNVVPWREVADAYQRSSGTRDDAALNSMARRLRHRLATVDLELHRLRLRGLMLEPIASLGVDLRDDERSGTRA